MNVLRKSYEFNLDAITGFGVQCAVESPNICCPSERY